MTLLQIFSIKNVSIYLLIMNILEFLMFGYDKHQAKVKGWRTSELTLFIILIIGGGIGGIAGMYIFHHKTKKWYFKYGFPILTFISYFVFLYLFFIKI